MAGQQRYKSAGQSGLLCPRLASELCDSRDEGFRMHRPEKIVLRICTTCITTAATPDCQKLDKAIADAGLSVPVEVVPQSCMNGCSRPTSMALQGDGMATYFFSDIEPAEDLNDIVSTLKAYLNSLAGWIEDARPCGRLRSCLIGRVPALTDQ